MESDARGQVIGSAAATYEAFFVPALFQEWGPRVADAAAVGAGQRVLDVACGTGALTREIARRVGADHTAGLDRNEDMLAVARAREPAIEWVSGRAEELPYEDGDWDAVVSQFGLMFFDDRVRALREMWRVARPGGRLAVAVWGPLEETPGYATMVALLDELFGEAIARELRAPFCLGSRPDLRALFAAAGIDDVRVDTIVGRATFPSIESWVHTDIRGWTLADAIDDDQYRVLQRAAQSRLAPFAGPRGVAFDSPAHIVSATRPK